MPTRAPLRAVSIAVCILGFSTAACSALLGFEELTGAGDGGSSTGDGSIDDGASTDGNPLDGQGRDAGGDSGTTPPSHVTAAPAACIMSTLIAHGCDGGSLCAPTSIAVEDDATFYVSEASGAIARVALGSTPLVSSVPIKNVDGGATVFNAPTALALDRTTQTLYVGERYRLDAVPLSSSIATSIAGSSTGGGTGADGIGAAATFGGITGVAHRDSSASAFIADHVNVRMVTLDGGVVTTLNSGEFGSPQAVAQDPSGTHEVFFAVLNGGGNPPGVYAFSPGAPAATRPIDNQSFSVPFALAIDGSLLYVADVSLGGIFALNVTANPITSKRIAGAGASSTSSDGECLSATFEQPTAIAIDSQHHILMVDNSANTLREIDQSFGKISVSWALLDPIERVGPIGYVATARASGQADGSCTTTTASCTIAGLTSGVKYDVSVVSTTSTGSSGPSPALEVTPN